jgi:dolichol-phosphate mannosyltransferase
MNLSIVIPTYNEKENIRFIVERIRDIMRRVNKSYEILFVDDSSDDTPAILAEASRRYPEVRYLHRTGERGLATAVAMGFEHAKGENIIVMDADLQHPPELIPFILKRLTLAEVVIPSRFINGGSDGGLNGFRKFVSWTARLLGQLSLRRLRNISDCTGGFFGLRRSVIQGVKLEPVGWKILMEVLVRGTYSRVHEIPYSFQVRDAGNSKMCVREQLNYLRHIVKLVVNSPEDRRFYSFCLIGTLGVAVNILSLSVLLDIMQADALTASVFASFIAMVHNFFWNDKITWQTSKQASGWRCIAHFPQFVLVSTIGILITTLVARASLSLGQNIYLGQLTGILVATYWSFLANDRWTWNNDRKITQPKLIITREYADDLAWNDPKLALNEIGNKEGVK